VILSFCDYDVALSQEHQNPALHEAREPNDFTAGPIPKDFSALAKQLIMISFAYNNFNDTGLPSALKEAQAARSIYLQGNQFNGPMNFADMQWADLRLLNLENNSFSGDFPSESLSTLDAWEYLSVANNPNIVGHVSEGLCKEIRGYAIDHPGNPQIGTLRALNIRNTGIGCVAQCWMNAHNTDPYFELHVDKKVGVCASDDQVEALQELYSALEMESNPLYSNWNFDDNSNPCGWYGIVCDSGRRLTQADTRGLAASGSVTELQMASTNLEGQLPDGLGRLTSLKVLNMSFNNIGGSIPNQYWADLSSLQTFDVRGNGMFMFTSDMDFSSSGSPVTSLLLADNHFMGQLPQGLADLTSLQTLDISKNYLSGHLDAFADPLKSLQVLLMADNYFTGVLSGCGLVGHASYVDARTSSDHSWDCIAECWAPVVNKQDTTTKLVTSSGLKLCGNTPGSPTAAPTAVPGNDDIVPGMPTKAPGVVDDDVAPGMPTKAPGVVDDDVAPGMPTMAPGVVDDDVAPGMPTKAPSPFTDDDYFPNMPTKLPGMQDDDNYDDDFFPKPTIAPTRSAPINAPTIAPTAPQFDDDFVKRPTPVPSKAPTKSSMPTPAPSQPGLRTEVPTMTPTEATAVDIDITIKVMVLGVSADAWSASQKVYDDVFKAALVDTIANNYITTNNVVSVVVTALSPQGRRALLRHNEEDQRRRLETDRVEVQARIVAQGVIGDTPDTIDLRLREEVDNGDFTRNLRNEAKLDGATGLEEAEVEEFQSSSTSTPNSSDKAEGLSLDAIYGIAFGSFGLCLICCVCYYLTASAPKSSSDEDAVDVNQQQSATGIAVAPKHTAQRVTEDVVNPMNGGDAGGVRSFGAGKAIAPEAPTRDSDFVPPEMRKSAHVPNIGEEDDDEYEAGDSFDGVSPLHTSGEFGGEKFTSQLAAASTPPVVKGKSRQPSFISRRDTIPMTPEMAAAAAAATANAEEEATVDDEVIEKHASFSDAQKTVAADPGSGSSGLTRAEFFAKKLGKTGTAKSPGKGVESAAEEFEEL
jgi:hypothetical protein